MENQYMLLEHSQKKKKKKKYMLLEFRTNLLEFKHCWQSCDKIDVRLYFDIWKCLLQFYQN